MSKQQKWGQLHKEIPGIYYELVIDNTPVRPVQARTLQKLFAWVVIFLVFMLGWQDGTSRAIEVLLGISPMPEYRSTLSLSSFLQSLLQAVIICATAIVAMLAFQSSARPVRPHRTGKSFLLAFAAATVAAVLGFQLADLLSGALGQVRNSYPVPPVSNDDLPTLFYALDSALAGPTEELALTALLVLALRATGHSWVWVYVAAILFRLPFHLYYGWGAFGLMIWPVLIVAVYRRTGMIMPIILAHSAFNMSGFVPLAKDVLEVACTLLIGVIAMRRLIESPGAISLRRSPKQDSAQ